MKDDNKINEANILSGTSRAFMKKYKEMLKLRAESSQKNNELGKEKVYNKIFKKNSINKYKTISKLPTIKNNKNYNYSQYIKNININNKRNHYYSPKNNLFNFANKIELKSFIKLPVNTKEKLNNSNNNNNFNLNNIILNTYHKNTIIDGNLSDLTKNKKELLSKINYNLNNSNINNEVKEDCFNKNYEFINQFQSSITPKIYFKNIKYINKNKSTENFNINNLVIKKDNKIIYFNNSNRNEKSELIKKYAAIFKSAYINRLYDLNVNIKELKNSNSEQNIFKSIKTIKKINIKNKNTDKNHYNIAENILTLNNSKNYFIVYPGNNGKLVENIILTRSNWEKLPDCRKKHDCNFLWTPLSIQINFNYHKAIDQFHVVNHFEFQSEITNKRNIFINLLKYCEFNDINLFSFSPLTIILPLHNDNFNVALENFKKCYFDLPNLVEDPNNKNSNFLDKNYRSYFNAKSNLKLGSTQKLIIPKTHYNLKNLWLIKRINLNRGREIKVLNDLEQIINEIMEIKSEQRLKYIIIQKYIEKPLLYYNRKFDIRIWVLFSYMLKANKFEAYVFKEGHLKASSESFDINSLDLFIHLTNYSVQKYSKNFSKMEIGNEISFNTFQKELDIKSKGVINFKRDIFENIIKIISITANIAKNKINGFNRKNCFEIFGYDFILDEDYNPFLLEINTNPGYEISSPIIEMLLPRMIDDALRLTIDKEFERKDKYKNCSQFHVDDYKDEEIMWQKIKL